MQIIEDKVYAFSKDNPPCYTAQPGEVLQFNTLDCFSGRLTDETGARRPFQLDRPLAVRYG